MRNKIAFAACLALMASPFVGTANARIVDSSSPPYGNPTNANVAGPTVGDHYIVNPIEVSSTRDNRGSFVAGDEQAEKGSSRDNGNWDHSKHMNGDSNDQSR